MPTQRKFTLFNFVLYGSAAAVVIVALIFIALMFQSSKVLRSSEIGGSVPPQVRQWATIRNDTFSLNPGGSMFYGPFAGQSTRVAITADHAVNIAFFPASWKDQLVSNPALIRANWNSAKCANSSILQTSITCELDNESALAIQDVRQPIDAGSVVGAAIAHKLTGANTTEELNSSRVHLQVEQQQYQWQH